MRQNPVTVDLFTDSGYSSSMISNERDTAMIDFHSHILPGIDDGSRSRKMSLAMIAALAEQGVDTIVASSHFYASDSSPELFLARRQEAYEKLISELPAEAPGIRLGAEILYYPGISHMEQLPELCIEGTNALLLEMPFMRWSRSFIREVLELAAGQRYTVILAHFERYSEPSEVWESLMEHGVLMQSNADYYVPLRTRHQALKLLRDGRIHLLGSDAHNLAERAPHMDEAARIIRRSCGQGALDEIDRRGRELLGI